MKQLAGKGNMNQRMDAVLYRFRSRMSAYPPGMCPLKMYHSLFQMSMNQSCGKCVPCRDGLVEAEKLLRDIINGDGTNETLDKLQNMCTMIAQTADCAVGVVAAELLLDSFREFPDEYESHINNKSCVKNVVQTVPCVTLCPAHVNVPGYVALIKEGKYDDAVALIRDRNPFPTACAMVCEHPCENKCRRKIIDEAINIRGLKKYAVDNASESVAVPPSNVSTGKKVAVIGGGPSGLTAAWFLALMGHKVVVYEEHEKLGGMLRYGIPEYRLPKENLDRDIADILKAGDIEVHCNTKIGKDISFEKIRSDCDAVYLGLGAQLGNRMPIENADLNGVIPAADFLQNVAAGKAGDLTGKRVVIIGGGNVAMDAARTAVRLNAEAVHVFTRKRDDYTALESEIVAAMQEGVHFRTLLSFLHIEEDKEKPGNVSAVWLQPEIVGELDRFGLVTTEHSSNYPYRFKCDLLILGVGQRSDVAVFEEAGVPTVRGRLIDADTTCMVKDTPGVFSGGDCVTGPSTAINAIAAGQVAAYNIDEYLGYHHKVACEVTPPPAEQNPCIPTGRAEIEERDPFERKTDFEHVELPMTSEEACRESGRCLRCDYYGCGSMVGGSGT